MLLTDFMDKNEFRERFGQALVALVCFGVLTNLIKFIIQVVIFLRKKMYFKKLLQAKL
jgi:hypothetical protein